MFNFNDTTEMMIEASPHYRVSDIPIPVVAVNAGDDPFCPRHGKQSIHFYSCYNIRNLFWTEIEN